MLDDVYPTFFVRSSVGWSLFFIKPCDQRFCSTQQCCSVLPLFQRSFVLYRVTFALLANHESLAILFSSVGFKHYLQQRWRTRINSQKLWSASMKQVHVFGTPFVPLTTIALFGDFCFNSVYTFCKLIRGHSHHLLNAAVSCSEHTLF